MMMITIMSFVLLCKLIVAMTCTTRQANNRSLSHHASVMHHLDHEPFSLVACLLSVNKKLVVLGEVYCFPPKHFLESIAIDVEDMDHTEFVDFEVVGFFSNMMFVMFRQRLKA